MSQASFPLDAHADAKKKKETLYRIQFSGRYDEHKDAGSAIEMTGSAPHDRCLRAYKAFLAVMDEK